MKRTISLLLAAVPIMAMLPLEMAASAEPVIHTDKIL